MIRRYTKKFFFGGFAICLLILLTIAIRYPQNNLIPSKMFVFMLLWIMILRGIEKMCSVVENRLYCKGLDVERISRTGFVFCIVIYGIFLYVISIILRSDPVTDYGYVYNTAYDLAMKQTVENWDYFSMWTNNLGVLFILTHLMRIGILLGMEDPYYFVLLINVLQVCITLLSLIYLTGVTLSKSVRSKKKWQWMTLICFSLWTPVWVSTKSFYSDQLSFGGSVIAIALFIYSIRNRKKSNWILISVSAIIWSICGFVKITAVISLLALIICIIGAKNRVYIKEKICMFFVFILCFGLLSFQVKSYPSTAEEYQLKMPIEYWIAMGLIGNGTYAENTNLVEGCLYCSSLEERTVFCRKQILENWTNLFDSEHLVRKVSVIFGLGEISPTSHVYPIRESYIWHWVHWEGNYYWKYSCLSTGFFFATLFLLFVGCVRECFYPSSRDSKEIVFLVYLTIFGVFLFLMMWEAQNKQLYNHIPWLTFGMVHGLESLSQFTSAIFEKISERRQKDVA